MFFFRGLFPGYFIFASSETKKVQTFTTFPLFLKKPHQSQISQTQMFQTLFFKLAPHKSWIIEK